MNMPFPLRLYRALSRALAPFVPFWLKHRLKQGKEDGARLGERSGSPGLPRPAGRLIWLHAASVGETMSILPMIEALAQKAGVLLTTGTLTSAALAASRLPQGAMHQFIPLDTPRAVKRFFAHWQPDLGLICESELWPNLILEAEKRKIPLGLINARLSERSFKRWRMMPQSAARLLRPLAFCLAQSEADAARFSSLGTRALCVGNLKFDVPALPVSAEDAASLKAIIGTRPVFVAASTHPGEEALVLAAINAARAQHPELFSILVPRHPERGAEVAALCEKSGVTPARRSLGAMPQAGDALYLADTLGELGLFYRLADIAFIGGSLVPTGGHNPIEAAKHDAALITGPFIANFKPIFENLIAQGGAMMVQDQDALAQGLTTLLGDEATRKGMIEAARGELTRHEGALARSLAIIAPFLASRV